MRQQNNGRRRQNRGSNRKNFNNGNLNGNINKNTVIDSSGPDGRQRGSVAQLNEKYFSLAEEFTGSNGLNLQSDLLEVQTRIHQSMAKTLPGSKMRADWEARLEENKKKTKEVNEKQDKVKAEILEVEKRIKERYQ